MQHLHTSNCYSNITGPNRGIWYSSSAAVDDHVECVVLSSVQNTLIATLKRATSYILSGL